MKRTPLKRTKPIKRAVPTSKNPQWASAGITASKGLLWQDGQVIPLPRADSVAIERGFRCAEEMVRSLQETRKPRRQLRPVSPKLAAKNAEYEAAKRRWRKSHDGRCEVVYDSDISPIARGSTGQAAFRCCRSADKNPHHMAGRGPNLSRVETFLGVCRQCHDWIHSHAREARRLGYLLTK